MAEQVDLQNEAIRETLEASAVPALTDVIEDLRDGILLIDDHWRLTYANQAARKISRLTPGDLNGKTHWELYPETLGTTVEETYRSVMTDRQKREIEAFFYAPFSVWLSIRVLPVEGGIALYYRDVSAEHQAVISEERYRVLTELSPQSLWTADANGNVLYANQRFLDYIGHDFVPRNGDEYIACFDEADRARVLQVWTESVVTGKDYAIDARLIRASDGASRWWRLRAGPIRNDAGRIEQWLGTAFDVHDERIAEDILRKQYAEIDRQRRELEAIYYGAPFGLALYHPTDFSILRINEYQARVLRISPQEALGLRYPDLTAGVPAAQAYMRRAAAGETIANVQLEGSLDRFPNDHRHWTATYSPIKDELGTVVAVAVATIEITHQRRSEAALIQSEKLAAVGRMASSIAHEINNPLESVTNLLYIARTYSVIPEVQNFLDLADQELRRVSIIANQTLRFHKQATLPREISCFDLFSTVLSLYEGRLKNSSIQVEKRKRAMRPIACFEGDIRQVLNNLVSNAIDAMPIGGRLVLRSREATDWRTGRRGVVLTVADTGSGMSPETRAHVFEAFYTTKGMNGTGLGLWIGSGIVDRHEGRLLLRTSQQPPHNGTVFSLFLPFQSLLPSISPLVQ
jgi:PAS domain S-box-containing protein